MLLIYNSKTIRAWDEYTIQNEPISSIDLMERAATECLNFITKFYNKNEEIMVVCGNGNNGGDGLALARMLIHTHKEVSVYLGPDDKRSPDNAINLKKLQAYEHANIKILQSAEDLILPEKVLLVDCIFGTGIDKPVRGFWADIISKINHSAAKVISIDLPSGLTSEPFFENDKTTLPDPECVIKAHTTLTFQVPKLSMMIPGWGDYCGQIEILDIGLSQAFLKEHSVNSKYVDLNSVLKIFKSRNKFSHKGNYGHALLIAGNKGTCGAGILSAKACIKSGAGLVTLLTSEECKSSVHASVPEIMLLSHFEDMVHKNHQSIGIGPGIGKEKDKTELLKNLLSTKEYPLVMDADALNILSEMKAFSLPPLSILTPHPKEFDRLTGPSENAWNRLEKARTFALKHQVILVLKGANTVTCCPNGQLFFNSTGNPGMATAGSGDVLTGIILSFMAQGYSSVESAILGVYCHGYAGDLAAQSLSCCGMVASDIIDFLNPVFKRLESENT